MAKSFLLPCKCGSKITVVPSQAGDTVACGNCGEKLPVPTLRELNQLETVENLAPAKVDRREESRRSWSGWRGFAMAMLLGFGALALIRGGYYGWALTTIDTSGSAEEALQRSSEIIDKMEEQDLVAAWLETSRMALEEKNRPTFYYNQKDAAYVKDIAIKSTVIGAVSLILAFAVGFLAKKK